MQQLASLPIDEQLKRLQDNVFPPKTGAIHIEFLSAPHSWNRSGARPPGIAFPAFPSLNKTLLKSGFNDTTLLLPAATLVDVAAQLGRLPEIEALLSDRVEEASQSNVDRRLLRALLAIAGNRTTEASEQMFQLLNLLSEDDQVNQSIGAILALIWKASPNPSLREASMSLSLRCYEVVGWAIHHWTNDGNVIALRRSIDCNL
ncbi:MAG: hypothetical protein R3C05_10030 [Pirellulaceae bacterium]